MVGTGVSRRLTPTGTTPGSQEAPWATQGSPIPQEPPAALSTAHPSGALPRPPSAPRGSSNPLRVPRVPQEPLPASPQPLRTL